MATATMSSTAVEATASAMEATTSVETTATAVESAHAVAVEAVIEGTASVAAVVAVRHAVISIAWAIALVSGRTRVAVAWPAVSITRATVVAAAPIPSATIMAVSIIAATVVAIAAIPGTGPDEEATNKVIRSVIAIGRASVGVITVIPVSANRRGADSNANWTDSDAYRNLGFGLTCCGGEDNCE